MRNGLIFLLVILMLLPWGVGLAQDEEQAPEDDPALLAATWLAGQQEENGSFSNDDFGITVLVLMALASVEQPNPAAITWVENYVLDNSASLSLGSVSAALLAISANGIDPEVFANGTLPETHHALIATISTDEISEFDLCWGLAAVSTLEREIPAAALAVLLLLQHEDGGFGTGEGESDPFLSSICLQALLAADEQVAAQRVLEYFRATQQEDGGWRAVGEGDTDGFTTGIVLMALEAAHENLEDWSDPLRTLMRFRSDQTGAFFRTEDEADEEALSIGATSVAIMALQRKTLLDAQLEEETAIIINPETNEGPTLEPAWQALAGGLHLVELDTADDLFTTTVNPDTEEEMFGIQIINWAATNDYTRFLVTSYLSADILLWMGHYDPAIWEQISEDVLRLLPNHVLILLPEQVQARIAPESTAEPTSEVTEEPEATAEPTELP